MEVLPYFMIKLWECRNLSGMNHVVIVIQFCFRGYYWGSNLETIAITKTQGYLPPLTCRWAAYRRDRAHEGLWGKDQHLTLAIIFITSNNIEIRKMYRDGSSKQYTETSVDMLQHHASMDFITTPYYNTLTHNHPYRSSCSRQLSKTSMQLPM